MTFGYVNSATNTANGWTCANCSTFVASNMGHTCNWPAGGTQLVAAEPIRETCGFAQHHFDLTGDGRLFCHKCASVRSLG